MDNEAGWVEEARGGSAEAFSRLVRLHHAPIRAYLSRYVRDRETADDLAQETFLSAFRSLPTWRGDAPMRMWLLGIARNRALTHLRDAERRRAHIAESIDAIVASLLTRRIENDVPAVHERRLAALRACLETLPAASAGMVDEFYFKGRTAVEMARESGKKESAIWMALLRARLALRQCVEGRLATEAGR
jgi:RNA polymerase sigma-70 factor (ECF subfamily)